jgi:GT2 family glycosyltransferase
MKLSWVIPYMESDAGKREILKNCTDSATGYDELIISGNMREGYAVPINRGARSAKGDFILISNDDLIWDGGSLKRLCDENAVVSPVVNGKSQPFWGCAFCVPKWVWDKVGGMWEGYRISYYDDADFVETLKKFNIPYYCNEQVNVQHLEGGRTLHTFVDHNEFYEENHKKFIERWGKDVDF